MSSPKCRSCGSLLTVSLADLGSMPLANSFLTPEDIDKGTEQSYPLHARVCPQCLLVQVDDAVPPEHIFSDYAYFSSYSQSWVEHARIFADQMIERFSLGSDALVIEIASNDGYLLQHFKNRHIRVLGIEPAQNVARAALEKGIPTETVFFNTQTARRLAGEGKHANLMVANNVLAHVPEIENFLTGFSLLLKPEGVAVFEFPHILNLIKDVQFDTIYHEHFFYLSLVALEKILNRAGLRAIEVEQLSTHGGSLRLYTCRKDARHKEDISVEKLRAMEHEARLDRLEGYRHFAKKVKHVTISFQSFLARAKKQGKLMAGYGAAAKGNTFLNYCGIGKEDLACVFDANPAKQGRFLPGSHIPVFPRSEIERIRPDYLLILPWNLASEIRDAAAIIEEWGGQFVTAVPETRLLK